MGGIGVASLPQWQNKPSVKPYNLSYHFLTVLVGLLYVAKLVGIFATNPNARCSGVTQEVFICTRNGREGVNKGACFHSKGVGIRRGQP